MRLYQVIILSVVQGLAELLPVSSSAHVIVAEKLMGLDPSSPEMTFLLVMLHAGTMGAVLLYFWPRWRPLLLAGRRWHFLKMIALASLLTAIVFLGLKILIENFVIMRLLDHDRAEIEQLFKELPLIAAGLLAAGLLIFIAGQYDRGQGTKELSPRVSIGVGLVQGLCIPFRGFSRSGATISTALIQGTARSIAEDFSFALAVVLTPPAMAWEFRRFVRSKAMASGRLTELLMPGALGMIFSLAAGLVALRLLSALLERGRWKYFGYYCIAAALVIAALGASGF
jgi:undecaprenyl-diphosphatase